MYQTVVLWIYTRWIQLLFWWGISTVPLSGESIQPLKWNIPSRQEKFTYIFSHSKYKLSHLSIYIYRSLDNVMKFTVTMISWWFNVVKIWGIGISLYSSPTIPPINKPHRHMKRNSVAHHVLTGIAGFTIVYLLAIESLKHNNARLSSLFSIFP